MVDGETIRDVHDGYDVGQGRNLYHRIRRAPGLSGANDSQLEMF